ncbi:6912_t:CDS:2 [Diversispora eburnea]|uniref:6912_t:CDS:1 n=1 Tax=Diversispora eburnea TaxID=1213867 RepID=A0A9N9FGF8_9GLOM|nr:6912_t:CDS:2 [Diversispora eburnea]
MKLFKLGDITSDIRHNLATNPLVNNDIKHLNKLINTERSVWNSLNNWANDQADSSKCLAVWGRSEDIDLCDVTEKLGILTAKLAKLGTNLATQYGIYRAVEQKLKDLRKELEIVEKDTIEEETQLADFKRKKLKSALMIQFDAWYEFGQKLVTLTSSGKEIVDQIPIEDTKPGDPRAPYHGKEETEQIVINAIKSVDEWAPSKSQKLLTYQPISTDFQTSDLQKDFQITHSQTNSQISDLQISDLQTSDLQKDFTNSQSFDLQSDPRIHSQTNSQPDPRIHSQHSRTTSQTSNLQPDPQTTNIQADSQSQLQIQPTYSSIDTLSPLMDPKPPQNTPIIENSEFSFERRNLPLPVLPELPTDKFSNYFEDSTDSTDINNNNDDVLNQSTTESYQNTTQSTSSSSPGGQAKESIIFNETITSKPSPVRILNQTDIVSPLSTVGTSLEIQIVSPPDQQKHVHFNDVEDEIP